MSKKPKELLDFIDNWCDVLALARSAIKDAEKIRGELGMAMPEEQEEAVYATHGRHNHPATAQALQRELMLYELRKERLRANDVVVLRGSVGPQDTRELLVNGHDPIRLKRREFLFMQVLANERQAGGGFLSVHELVERIQAETNRINKTNKRVDAQTDPNEGFWVTPTAEDLYTIVFDLRAKLRAAGLNDELIENGPRGKGYRLSTPAANIEVLVEMESDADVCTWQCKPT